MGSSKQKAERRARIRKRLRSHIRGTADRPRLSVYRSNTQIYAQIIDDEQGRTLASCSSRIKDVTSQALTKTEKSRLVGKELARIAQEKGVDKVVFDRGGYLYHGRVKALAEGARDGGLSF
jgi:large subunit ribosomal protein L18